MNIEIKRRHLNLKSEIATSVEILTSQLRASGKNDGITGIIFQRGPSYTIIRYLLISLVQRGQYQLPFGLEDRPTHAK